MSELTHLTLATTLQLLENKELSLPELYAEYQTAVTNQNTSLNMYVSQNDQALTQAKSRSTLPLQGVPIAVKDNFCTKDTTTTASSKLLEEFVPAYESTVTTKLYQAGGVLFGKTNLDAWAHGSSTETSDYGTTKNPRNPDHLPGGSSGGSAAAVAADACVAALGTETAGSIRLPASWCGTVGLKPTYGRVSRYGVVAMASSTDSPGPITKTVEDSAIMLNAIAGHDPYDGTSSSQSVPDFTKNLGKNIKGLRIGVMYLEIAGMETVTPHFQKTIQELEALGAIVKPVSALDPHYAISVYTIVQRGEVSSNLARFTGVRYGHDRSYFADEARRRILLGTYTLSKGYSEQYYQTAQKVRSLFMQDFNRLFNEFDVLISPTTPNFAEPLGASQNSAMFGELMDMLLEPSSITGLPAISVPCYRDPKSNLYLGLNIMAPMWQEEKVIQVADAYERSTNWNSWRHDV